MSAVTIKESRQLVLPLQTVLDAVFHVVEHFSYHLGQILYIYKLRTGEDPGFYRQLDKK